MYTSFEELEKLAENSPAGRVTLALQRGDQAWHPASTKRKINGPAIVRYTFWHDGGVDADVAKAATCGSCKQLAEVHLEGWLYDHTANGEPCPGNGSEPVTS